MNRTTLDAVLDSLDGEQLQRMAYTATALRDSRAGRGVYADNAAERQRWSNEADFWNEVAIILRTRQDEENARAQIRLDERNPFRVLAVTVE
jgi:hypothetical protein